MGDDYQERIFVLRLYMDEMNVEAVYLRKEVRKRI